MMLPARRPHRRSRSCVPWYAALYRARRLDLHPVVLHRRERRALHGRASASSRAAAPLVLPAGRVQRFVSVVAVPDCGGAAGGGDRRAGRRARRRQRIGCARCCGSGSSRSSVFFSLSAGKQDLYIFPIVPAVAALAGTFIVRADFGLQRRWRTALRATAAAMGALLALGGAGVLYLFQSAGSVYALDGAAVIGAIAVVGRTAALLIAATRPRRGSRCSLRRRVRGHALDVRAARAPELRTLQAGACFDRRDAAGKAPARRTESSTSM